MNLIRVTWIGKEPKSFRESPRELLQGSGIPEWSPFVWKLGWAIVVIGAVLRLSLYLWNRSLWGDEASLAVNLMNRSFAGLCKRLDYEQAAPIGFLIAEKTAVLVFGGSECALRLLPLLGGIGSLVLGLLVARRLFPPLEGLIALTMMVLSKSLIRYSAELKQYSTDAMLSMAILLVAVHILQQTSRSKGRWESFLLFVGIGAIGVWFSHPAVFVFAGTAVVLAIQKWRAGWTSFAGGLLGAAGLCAASAFAQYYFFARSLNQDAYLMRFWAAGMMPVHSLTGFVPWLICVLPLSLEGLFGSTGKLLSGFLIVLGFISLTARHRWAVMGVLTAPILCVLAASALQKYPFSNRLILFLMPQYILIAASGFDCFLRWLAPNRKWIAFAILAGLLAEPAVIAVKACFRPPLREDMKPVLAYLQMHRQTGDRLYVHFRGRPAFEYYAVRFGLSSFGASVGNRQFTKNAVEADLLPLHRQPRVWVLRTNNDDSAELALMAALNDVATAMPEKFSAKGVQLDLYHLR